MTVQLTNERILSNSPLKSNHRPAKLFDSDSSVCRLRYDAHCTVKQKTFDYWTLAEMDTEFLKYFSLFIREPDGFKSGKNRSRKSHDTLPLKTKGDGE